MWLSGWSVILCTKESWVRFPVSMHFHIVGSTPGQSMYKGQSMFLTPFFSLSLSLSEINKVTLSLGEDSKKKKKIL